VVLMAPSRPTPEESDPQLVGRLTRPALRKAGLVSISVVRRIVRQIEWWQARTALATELGRRRAARAGVRNAASCRSCTRRGCGRADPAMAARHAGSVTASGRWRRRRRCRRGDGDRGERGAGAAERGCRCESPWRRRRRRSIRWRGRAAAWAIPAAGPVVPVYAGSSRGPRAGGRRRGWPAPATEATMATEAPTATATTAPASAATTAPVAERPVVRPAPTPGATAPATTHLQRRRRRSGRPTGSRPRRRSSPRGRSLRGRPTTRADRRSYRGQGGCTPIQPRRRPRPARGHGRGQPRRRELRRGAVAVARRAAAAAAATRAAAPDRAHGAYPLVHATSTPSAEPRPSDPSTPAALATRAPLSPTRSPRGRPGAQCRRRTRPRRRRAAPPVPPKLDLDDLADKVQRRLVRQLAQERTRRGYPR